MQELDSVSVLAVCKLIRFSKSFSSNAENYEGVHLQGKDPCFHSQDVVQGTSHRQTRRLVQSARLDRLW